MPNLASRYQSGTAYAERDSSVGLKGPSAAPKPGGAGIAAGAGGTGRELGGSLGPAAGAEVAGAVAVWPNTFGRHKAAPVLASS